MKTVEMNREILRLSLPSIMANITVPIVGMVDTAVAGHLASTSTAAASFISAISLGSMMFNLLYWNFGFLRTGTSGVTAQAFGREDPYECGCIFFRSISLAVLSFSVVLLLQWPFAKLTLLVTNASDTVESLAARYFFIRIWAAPATISLMAFKGWFVGMQDTVSSMWADLIVNIVNIAASIILTFGIGVWDGMGFDGIAAGTVLAQYSGLLYCVLTCCLKYGAKVFRKIKIRDIRGLYASGEMKRFLSINADLFLRSVGFIGIYIGYTMIAATLGDLLLACSSIMMQLMMFFSYFTDGFAYAGEALTGRFIGARQKDELRMAVKYIFIWSMSLACGFLLIYKFFSIPMLKLMTSDALVVEACTHFLPWLILMPPLGCAAFTYDGIYLGATASRPIRDTMLAAMVAFFAAWLAGHHLTNLHGYGELHLLFAAYFIHLVVRTVWLSLCFKRHIFFRAEPHSPRQ